jgi:hypothetical protein
MKFKSVYCIISLEALIASAAANLPSLYPEGNHTQALRSLRGKGMGGMGKGMEGGGGWGGGGSNSRQAAMTTIHNLFANRNKIEREVTETNQGVSTYTHSTDEQVSDWIKSQ